MTEQAEQRPRIYAAIADIVAQIGAIGKNHRASEGVKYAYRSIDDVVNTVHPLLAEHRLFSVAAVLEERREEKPTYRDGKVGPPLKISIMRIRYTYFADDGSSISTEAIGEAFDSGDKASSKAQTVAYRIAMCQLFSIPTEELIDTEAGEQLETAGENMELERRLQAAILSTKDTAGLDSKLAQLTEYGDKRELTKQQADRLKLLAGEQERTIRKNSEQAAIEQKATDAIKDCQNSDALRDYEAKIAEYHKQGKLARLQAERLHLKISERVRELRNAVEG